MAGVRKPERQTQINTLKDCVKNKRKKSEALYEGHREPELAEGAKPVSATPALIESKSKRSRGRNIPLSWVFVYSALSFLVTLSKTATKKLQD